MNSLCKGRSSSCTLYRSAYAKFRCGVAPIKIETCRYGLNRVPVDQRVCETCNVVEDEFHVIMLCSNLSAITLKCIANEICECLTLIINQTITTGIFPNQLKIAKVVPIFKKNVQTDVKNYRPISVLPTIFKIFENVMQTQLMEYFTSHNLLASQQ